MACPRSPPTVHAWIPVAPNLATVLPLGLCYALGHSLARFDSLWGMHPCTAGGRGGGKLDLGDPGVVLGQALDVVMQATDLLFQLLAAVVKALGTQVMDRSRVEHRGREPIGCEQHSWISSEWVGLTGVTGLAQESHQFDKSAELKWQPTVRDRIAQGHPSAVQAPGGISQLLHSSVQPLSQSCPALQIIDVPPTTALPGMPRWNGK